MVPPDNQIDLKNIEGIKNLVDESGYDVEQLLSVLNALNAIKKNNKKKEDQENAEPEENKVFVDKEFVYEYRELLIWFKKKYTSPSPHFVKQSVLLRHAVDNATWIESGTYTGSTTAILSERFPIVHTIEPSKECLQIARQNLKAFKNIIFHNGCSEDCLESICKSLTGDICFWLDGHYSAGITFQGDKDTPIIYELETISKYINQFNKVIILIDDIRCSHIFTESYPSLDFYVDWAKSNNMLWSIEQDIFIIKNTKFIY